MRRKDWTEQMRDRMDGYEMAPPEGLWGDIESALDQRPRRLTAFSWWGRAAAAVAVLVVMGGATWLLTHEQEATVPLAMTPREPVKNVTSDKSGFFSSSGQQLASTDEPQEMVTEEVFVEDVDMKDEPLEKATEPDVVRSEAPVEIAESSGTRSELSVTRSESSVTRSESLVSRFKSSGSRAEASSARSGQSVMAYDKEERLWDEEVSGGASRRTWGIGLYAANAGGYQQPSPVMMNGGLLPSDQKPEPSYLAGCEERTDHHIPVSIGLTLRYHLDRRWALESGLVYTLLKSEFTHCGQMVSASEEQRLHNVGIPLTVSYRFWNSGRFSAYLAAGGEADLNVKATMTADGLSRDTAKDRPQWSVGAGVGLQYNLSPQLGVYVEPSARYYFDNGSAVETIYKEKPTVWHLRFGLRFDVR